MTPPLREHWIAERSVFERRLAQYGVRAQCADPVTGSSSMPYFGAKKRLTKSESLPGAVTMTPRRSSCLRRLKSGVRDRMSSSESNTAM